MSDTVLKAALYERCVQYAGKRILNANAALQNAQEAANEESKSTAGDKHDTSRAMMQIEVEQATRQLAEAEKLRDELTRINATKTYDAVVAGSLVKTSHGNYFVSIAAGKLDFEGQTYFAVSVSSPVVQALKGLKKGDRTVLNGNNLVINEVF
ncbi:MAG: 3-oxoacyl-ACP synthase [Bacteroidetes bacterium]|nr:3-oxoacyl-ACP synthase [Bacteroidota bacterium]